ncbi:sensor histidine kinase [Streptomyces sp. RK23]|uniref:sensor histidine kinase n=1 Tax=unclassified Streptomyces TaxID=2593676 RepID=UPI001B36744B|nr:MULTISPECIES: sensor histidine kinase [unclassified Streptomyces]MBQ0968790.1 sensor histidine kinase [Streptomyces sp. RK74B]MBQ1008132.1 sensor histidine kinase [Streptomyces sp. RK23]
MRRPGGWWRVKSTPEKVETYTRWSFHFFGVIEILALGVTAYGRTGAGLATALCLLVTVHATACMLVSSRALDWTRGRRPQPVRPMWALVVVSAVVSITAVVIAERGPSGEVETAAGSVYGGVLCYAAGVITLGVRGWRRRVAVVGAFAVGAGLLTFPLEMPLLASVVLAGLVMVTGGFLAATSIFSLWLLNAVYALDEAKETRVRLAVAEERLRFGRDLHDVMGRNLAVIALKSELAVQLSRRGRPEAVEQMIEVQRIAQESQREVRDVVRGYREAALEVELAGARGVLSAAGIVSEVTGETAGLPAEVQSALGWVVREATTNVLRHGDAKKVAVTVRMSEGRVVLTVENDGVAETTGDGPGDSAGTGGPAGTGGSGLSGLRERLSAVDGTLEAGPVGRGVFRLTAEVPLPAAAAGAALGVAS